MPRSCCIRRRRLGVYDAEDDQIETGKWIPEITYVCTDPVANGHLKAEGAAADANTPTDTSAQDKAEDAAREERRRVLANNKARPTPPMQLEVDDGSFDEKQ